MFDLTDLGSPDVCIGSQRALGLLGWLNMQNTPILVAFVFRQRNFGQHLGNRRQKLTDYPKKDKPTKKAHQNMSEASKQEVVFRENNTDFIQGIGA